MGTPDDEGMQVRPRRSLAKRLSLPMLSGKASVALLAACFGLTGLLLIPLAARLPPWIDFEIVLAAWWLVWVIALSVILHSGRQVSDDHTLSAPRNWLSGLSGSAATSSDSWGWGDLLWFLTVTEGCLYAIVVVLVLAVAIVGVWLLIEIVIPALAFLTYFLLRGMLARVANDEHGCEGNVGRAVAWAVVWATLYTAPVALIVWAAHMIHLKAVA